MKPKSSVKKCLDTISVWEQSLVGYSLKQLQDKPDKDCWSLGQVYLHLIDQTERYNMQQIEICLASNRNAQKNKSVEGQKVFGHNAFPALKLKGPSSNYNNLEQPIHIGSLRVAIIGLKKQITLLDKKISASKFQGKTKHPGFGYLNASEWLQFIEMHFRHHLRQKRRIDAYLKSVNKKSRKTV